MNMKTQFSPTIFVLTTMSLGLQHLVTSQKVELIPNRQSLIPCDFSPDCLCSPGAAEYGTVICDGMELGDFPLELQESRVFHLTLRNNRLTRISEAKLAGSGLWSLEISRNEIYHVLPATFVGLENTLTELSLKGNKLTTVPSESSSRLQKLKLLDLSENRICELHKTDFSAHSSTLKSIDLSSNSLTSVPEEIFWNLQQLEMLDLSNNNIIQIHSMAFKDGMTSLSHLKLANNLMGKIPIAPLQHLSNIESLDMTKNRISKIGNSYSSISISLKELRLDENSIEHISKDDFSNFNSIESLSLANNPITSIESFGQIGVKLLDMANCDLVQLNVSSLEGLERSLTHVDVSSNLIENFPEEIFSEFHLLMSLNLENNEIKLNQNQTIEGLRNSLINFQFGGENMRLANKLNQLGSIQQLKSISLPNLYASGDGAGGDTKDFELTSDSLRGLSSTPLERLHMRDAMLSAVRKGAFENTPSLSFIDLSDNKIRVFDDEAFNVASGSSVEHMILSNAIHFQTLPQSMFQHLINLVTLDLSNNHISTLPINVFHNLRKMKYLYLQDNEIDNFEIGTFHNEANPNLVVLDLSFNKIRSVTANNFRFTKLERLLLNDNKIETLEQSAFSDMMNLKVIDLQGNKISELVPHTFQNLHHLQILNLAFNQIEYLENFQSFDTIGTLSHLSVDLSYNKLERLNEKPSPPPPTLKEDSATSRATRSQNNTSVVNATEASTMDQTVVKREDGKHDIENDKKPSYEITQSNIVSLNLSFNNISDIADNFFHSVKHVLRKLDMSNNFMSNISNINNLRRLQSLDLSSNNISDISSLSTCKKLRDIDLRYNVLEKISNENFRGLRMLRYVDFSYNRLTSIPEELFQRTSLDIFKSSNNELYEIPIKALNSVQGTLRQVILDHNRISSITDSQLTQIQMMVIFDISSNHLVSIDTEAFCCVPHLVKLSLSSNSQLRQIEPNMFSSLSEYFASLELANISLTNMGQLDLQQLTELDLSNNYLTFLSDQSFRDVRKVRILNVGGNLFHEIPTAAWQSLQHLRTLTLARNPITALHNDSFVGLERLENLDLSNMDVNVYENDVFTPLHNLRTLKMKINENNYDVSISQLLRSNHALQHIEIAIAPSLIHRYEEMKSNDRSQKPNEIDTKSENDGVLSKQITSPLPKRLTSITLETKHLNNLNSHLLQSLQTRSFELNFNVEGDLEIDREFFMNLGRVQNLSLATNSYRTSHDLENIQTKGKAIENPITSYRAKKPKKIFLHDLKIGNNKWDCTCDRVGWTEKWLKFWRSTFCNHETLVIDEQKGYDRLITECQKSHLDFRAASCFSIDETKSRTTRGDRNDRSGDQHSRPSDSHMIQNIDSNLLNQLKTQMQCDAFSSSVKPTFNVTYTIMIMSGLFLITKMF